MQIKKIPNIAHLGVQLKALSPSTYYRIKEECAFPAIVSQAIRDDLLDKYVVLPNSVAAIRGTIIHKLFEERAKGQISSEEEYEDRWQHLVDKYELEIKQNYPTLRNFLINDFDKMYESCDAAMQIEPSNSSNSNRSLNSIPQVEVFVSIPNILNGKIDRIKIHKDKIEIIDYKSGAITDENGVIKKPYIYQLNLYALCYESHYKKTVCKLTLLQTSNLEEYNVVFDRAKYLEIINHIQDDISQINDSLLSQNIADLQNANEEHCRYCFCRHFCKTYMSSSFRSDTIVDGVVTDASSNELITLEDKEGGTFYVNKLHDVSIDDWHGLIGKHLVFVNVSSRIENVYKRTDRTLIFEITQ